jgi:hypothetical protein
MGQQNPERAAVKESALQESGEPITLRVVGSGIAGGIAGVAVMSPVIAGIPLLLDIFRLDSLATFAEFVIADANAILGIAFFVAGGAVVLPLFFVVTATFLPPREPRYLRGATVSSMFWVSFVYIFWPGGGAFVNAVFVVVTLVGHWIYGITLGLVMQRLTGIPEHRV